MSASAALSEWPEAVPPEPVGRWWRIASRRAENYRTETLAVARLEAGNPLVRLREWQHGTSNNPGDGHFHRSRRRWTAHREAGPRVLNHVWASGTLFAAEVATPEPWGVRLPWLARTLAPQQREEALAVDPARETRVPQSAAHGGHGRGHGGPGRGRARHRIPF